jgi:hypothetical protein
VIFCADVSAAGGEAAGTSVSTPRGSRASSLWAPAHVGAATTAATRKSERITRMRGSLERISDFVGCILDRVNEIEVNVRAFSAL